MIKNVEIKDPYIFTVHMKTASLMLPELLSDLKGVECLIQPKDYYDKVGENKFIENPIGSGPYKWHSQMIGSNIKLEAIPKHWRDGVPRYKYVNFVIIPEENTQISMLKTGEVDIIRIGRERVEELSKAGFNILSKPNAGTVIFNTNMMWLSPVFSDIRFRKALNLAINKEDIMKHIFDGMAKPIATYPGPAIHLFGCGGDSSLKPYPYDPKEAARLIKEGGWEGFEFTVASYPRAGCPEFQRLVETICGYWEKAGLKPKIMMTDWATWREKWRQRKTEGTISGRNSTIEPSCLLMLNRIRRDHYSKSDETSTNDPKLDALFDKALKSFDMAEVTKAMGDIYRLLYDQYYDIAICELDDQIATNKRVPKWDPGRRRNERNYNDLIKQP
jgi:peptide/nickel transport system substrate-binding protein